MLSICIPSYNRSRLKNCLESVLPSAEKYGWPVYIQDNYEGEAFDASGYGYAHIYYSQNDSNIGADLNMFRVLRRAETKYALWLGDDDILDSSKASVLVEYMNLEPDLLILGEGKSPVHFESAKNFYLQYEPNPIYFGNCVVRTDYLSKFDENKYLSSAPLHVYNVYINDYLCRIEKKRKSCCILIDNKTIIIRNGGGGQDVE